MTPEMIRQLPARHTLIIRGGFSPVVARLPMAWRDPAYRAARRVRTAATSGTVLAQTAGDNAASAAGTGDSTLSQAPVSRNPSPAWEDLSDDDPITPSGWDDGDSDHFPWQ